MKRDEFLKSQKVLRLATINKDQTPHIAPVWYLYSGKNIYIGTNAKTRKARNVKRNKHVSFCVDIGINAPHIYGVASQGDASLILKNDRVKTVAKRILLRYFETLEGRSARELLDDTDCIIKIVPKKFSVWKY